MKLPVRVNNRLLGSLRLFDITCCSICGVERLSENVLNDPEDINLTPLGSRFKNTDSLLESIWSLKGVIFMHIHLI